MGDNTPLKKPGSATDPLWYKDAVIYEIHVRAFADANNDGIGDFPGLLSRLDYLQDLGVTCLWLLPFMPSPLRDDGYDIADYTSVNPSYGTLADFKLFLDAAHQRGMQVMIELVINHTSDQHPWFQAARLAPPGSPERDMYVWSDTDKLYEGVRIIFTDTEKSNWTWDDTAKQFYWHRFFSHQPDLNFDNPRVMEEVLKAMRFWLDMGVDALRLDAIPYLIERDGTSCENVPETHVMIKRIREVIDAEYEDRLILAEANMWPADVRPYFGDGDECHMAFHFPLMPRIYMAIRQEDRLPITDIMAQTPEIPESCQWGIFLRNHDELTLEMVTDDERDYMNLAYAADARMRINVGIRRRLAPLVDNNRARIQLLNSLLLSFPGTPIMYYGDEIGMGDNIYLGDRNGVRTPMQWNSDRNAGFSRCDPARLYFPVIMDPVYGYQVVNVESQLTDQSSLLHWTRNMIALRKLFQVFGRGTLTFLHPENRKILAYIRDLKRDDGTHETVLCVANLSRFAQPVALDLTPYKDLMPVEMLGYVSFPKITLTPYPLSLAPYAFLWFELQPAPAQQDLPILPPDHTQATEQITLDLLTKGWAGFLAGQGADLLHKVLPDYLPRQRWFGAKSRTIQTLTITHYVELHPATLLTPSSTIGEAILFLHIAYTDATTDQYQLPIAYTTGDSIGQVPPATILATLQSPTGPAVLHDATTREDFRQSLLALITTQSSVPLHTLKAAAEEVATTIVAAHTDRPAHDITPTEAQPLTDKILQTHTIEPQRVDPQPDNKQLWGAPGHAAPSRDLGSSPSLSGTHTPTYTPPPTHPSRLSSAEQSNTNIFFGGDLLLKLFRRLQPGLNPDVEIGRFLTETAHFERVPAYLGALTLTSTTGEPTTTAMLQQLIPNEGDGWQNTLEELARFYESVATSRPPATPATPPTLLDPDQPIPEELASHAGLSLKAAALLGRRTAELHLALATPTDNPAFAAEPNTSATLLADAQRIDVQINLTLDALKAQLPTFKDLLADTAAQVLTRRIPLFAAAHSITASIPSGQRIRIHGDYHLGQILINHNDFTILDFEGEPAKTLAQRREKQSPLKDVAGMLRSFSYAAYAALDAYQQRHPTTPAASQGLDAWATLWQSAVSRQFLQAYRTTIAANPSLLPEPTQAQSLLNAYLLEKSLYELLYELNNRPTWVRIPLAGILALST